MVQFKQGSIELRSFGVFRRLAVLSLSMRSPIGLLEKHADRRTEAERERDRDRARERKSERGESEGVSVPEEDPA